MLASVFYAFSSKLPAQRRSGSGVAAYSNLMGNALALSFKAVVMGFFRGKWWFLLATFVLLTGCQSLHLHNETSTDRTDTAQRDGASEGAAGGALAEPQTQPQESNHAKNPRKRARGTFVRTPWAEFQHFALPLKRKTDYRVTRHAGRTAIAARADGSASMLRKRVIDGQLRHQKHALRFAWFVPALNDKADLAVRVGDDSPARLILSFDGDKRNWSAKNADLADLTRLVTGEDMPYATLVYAWCNKYPVGTVLVNPRTDRVRTLVVASGEQGLGRWVEFERNVAQDFEKAFGETAQKLTELALMTDADNTQSQASAWFGEVSWR